MASERTVRRHDQQWRAEFQAELNADPAYRRAKRNRQRRRYGPEMELVVRYLFCPRWGRTLGGRPPQERRCTKRLGRRYCWNWQVSGTDRCHKHPRPRS